MPPITDRTLILKAKALAQRKQASNDFQYGDVGCALVTQSGRVYLGCSIDTACSMGFCAEHSAIASMLAQGESRVQRIVAVKWNGQILPPCGRCREFMSQLSRNQPDIEVILGLRKKVPLRKLLPHRYEG